MDRVSLTRGAGGRFCLAGLWALAAAVALAVVLSSPRDARAESRAEPSFPRLANIYFGSLTGADLARLARWDLLVICRRGDDAWRTEIASLRQLNPDITIIAHCPIGYHGDWTSPAIEAAIRSELYAHNWWMRDTSGNRVLFPNGDGLLNLTVNCPRDPANLRLCDWLAQYIADTLGPGDIWDGVYLDFCMDDISWVNSYVGRSIDSNRDGVADGATALNQSWREGTGILVSRLRTLVGKDYIITTNGNNTDYECGNGSTRENFPWMHGDWYQNVTNPTFGYMAIDRRYLGPQVNVINSIWTGPVDANGPVKTPAFEKKVRFALASTLVYGDGYFSMDGGQGLPAHTQMWWHEYYDLDLGTALSDAEIPPAGPGDMSWIEHGDMIRLRRFENGVAVVNPSSWPQIVALGGAYYEPSSWNGSFYPRNEAVTSVSLEAGSGVVLVGSGHVVDCGAEPRRAAYEPYGESGVSLVWDTVSRAASYSVYRSMSRGNGAVGPKELVGVVSAPAFQDDTVHEGSVYLYWVAPIGDDLCEGELSSPAVVWVTPWGQWRVALAADDLDGHLVLSWSPPDIPDDLLFDVIRTDGKGERAKQNDAALSSESPGRLVDATCRPGESYDYEIVAETGGAVLGSVRVTAPGQTVLRTSLRGCWPQPMSERAVIAFDIGEDERRAGGAPTSLVVYDADGREVRRLLEASLPSGTHTVEWDGRSDRGDQVASGCYFYVLTVGGEASSGKALVVR